MPLRAYYGGVDGRARIRIRARASGADRRSEDELLAKARVIEMFGPTTGRPRVDTLNGSKHANMKELRFDADDGVWRIAFALTRAKSDLAWWPVTRAGKAKGHFTDA